QNSPFDSDANIVAAGDGHAHACGTVDVSGGAGGSSRCADFGAPYSVQAPGSEGSGPTGTPGGRGGDGGWDTIGPIYMGGGCHELVCCGLADFLVSGEHENAEGGEAGLAGADGQAGAGCSDPLDAFGVAWPPGNAGDGTQGHPGSGGGGGGAGGSALITWEPGSCEFADGLGGGGGGGGAGGCGGGGGTAGTAGTPSVGVVIAYSGSMVATEPPVLTGLTIITRAPGA
ncbi:unnamed protein product, partial [marine sediment metagenome]